MRIFQNGSYSYRYFENLTLLNDAGYSIVAMTLSLGGKCIYIAQEIPFDFRDFRDFPRCTQASLQNYSRYEIIARSDSVI